MKSHHVAFKSYFTQQKVTPLTTGCGFNSPEWFLLRAFAITSSTADNMIKICNGDEIELTVNNWRCEESWSLIKDYRKGYCRDDIDDTNYAIDEGLQQENSNQEHTIEKTRNGEEIESFVEQENIPPDRVIDDQIEHHIREISKGSEEGQTLKALLTAAISGRAAHRIELSNNSGESSEASVVTYDGKRISFFSYSYHIKLSIRLILYHSQFYKEIFA